MCLALPTGPRDQTRDARPPGALRIALGGAVLLAILIGGLLIERLWPRRI